jgi:allantoinase
MLVIRGRRVIVPDQERSASIHIENGRIVKVAAYGDVPADAEIVEAADLIVAPGLVDSHVHVNEPGRTEWEGFDTATRAAAAGGITTIVDMPLNSVPATTTLSALEQKRHAARGRCHVDVAFWGGVVPGNANEILPLIEGGVRGFKCFLTPSGVEEFAPVSEEDLRPALATLSRANTSGSRPLLVHAEDPLHLRNPSGDPRRYPHFLATRPVSAEVAAIEMVARLAREYHVAAHIVHVSSAEGAEAIAAAQAGGSPLTAETCPHYLTLAAEEVPEGMTAFKWHALARGTCALVASDHSPAPAALKCTETGDFFSAWGGIASLELSLAAVWTGAAARGFGVRDVVRWMSEAPASLCGLQDRKGAIRAGADADVIMWDCDATVTVDAERLQQRHKLTPYAGRSLRGVVRATYVRGVRVWEDGRLARAGAGHLL